MVNFSQNPIKLLALPCTVLLLTIMGATHTVPVPVSPPDGVSVCGAKFTLPAGSSAVKQDGALHVKLPPGYKYQGKSSTGEPLFAYDLQAAQAEEEYVFYCVCMEGWLFNEGHCDIYAEEYPDGSVSYFCRASYCSTCGIRKKKVSSDP